MFGFGFARHIWDIGYTYEALPLNNCLILLILLSYVHYNENISIGLNQRKNEKLGKIICLLSGLAMANQHQAMFIVFPVLIDVIFNSIKNSGATSNLLAFAIPLLLYIQLFYAANVSKTHWKWGHCDSFVGMIRHALQMDYGFSIFAADNLYVNAKQSIIFFTYALRNFFVLMSDNFGYLGWIFFTIGNIRVAFQKKFLKLWLLMVINILVFSKFLHTNQYKGQVSFSFAR